MARLSDRLESAPRPWVLQYLVRKGETLEDTTAHGVVHRDKERPGEWHTRGVPLRALSHILRTDQPEKRTRISQHVPRDCSILVSRCWTGTMTRTFGDKEHLLGDSYSQSNTCAPSESRARCKRWRKSRYFVVHTIVVDELAPPCETTRARSPFAFPMHKSTGSAVHRRVARWRHLQAFFAPRENCNSSWGGPRRYRGTTLLWAPAPLGSLTRTPRFWRVQEPWLPLCRWHEHRSVECPSCGAQALFESFDKNPSPLRGGDFDQKRSFSQFENSNLNSELIFQIDVFLSDIFCRCHWFCRFRCEKSKKRGKQKKTLKEMKKQKKNKK